MTGGEPMNERREWWIAGDSKLAIPSRESAVSLNQGVIHVREVLPDDPTPEWTSELIRLCSRTGGHPNEYRYDIHEHLAKRVEQ